jgi:hypothetical protein
MKRAIAAAPIARGSVLSIWRPHADLRTGRFREELMRTLGHAVALGTVMVLVVAAPAAGGSAATFTDPVGDTVEIAGPGSTPAYLDIVGVTVTKQAGTFEFSMDLAVVVPDEPVQPPQVKETWWFWGLDTDPTTFPFGFPRGPGLAFAPEFALATVWDGIEYSAFVVDRRPTLTGGAPVLTPIAFKIDGANISAFLDAATIDDSATFGFVPATRVWKGPPGTEGHEFTDRVMNTTGGFLRWPS